MGLIAFELLVVLPLLLLMLIALLYIPVEEFVFEVVEDEEEDMFEEGGCGAGKQAGNKLDIEATAAV
jgi:hypothetical protein